MDKYLIELLKEVNTIIIPGLGALTVTNKEKGEYMFMPYLKHDDGTLARHIAEREGWSENDAKNLIAKYVREIEAKLNVGESYDMYRFGSFRKSSGGDVEFEAWSTGEEDKEEQKELEVENTDTPELVEEAQEVIEETGKTDPEDQEEVDPHTQEVIDENAYQPEIVEETEPPVKEPETIPVVVAETEYTEEQQWNDDLDLPPINATVDRPKKPILEKTQKDRKRRKVPVLLIVLLVVLVGAASSVGIFYNELKTAFFAPESADTTKLAEGKQFEFTEEPEVEEVEPEEPEVQEEVVQPKEQPEVEPQPQQKPVPVPKPAPAPVKKEVKKVKPAEISGSFHLIIGSFKNQQFAESFSKKAATAGHASTILGPRDDFYLVTVGSYPTEADAKSALTEKQRAYPKVWLLKGN